MQIDSRLFNPKVIERSFKKHLDFPESTIANAKKIIAKWNDAVSTGSLVRQSESSATASFVKDVFCKILGYSDFSEGSEKWDIEIDVKTPIDSTRADCAIGLFSSNDKEIQAVIEFKSANTSLDTGQASRSDNFTPVEQAFEYSKKFGKKCKWVLVSNFKETRLYSAFDQTRYESYKLENLQNDATVREFIRILSKDNFLVKTSKSEAEVLYERSKSEEIRITREFYKRYQEIRNELFSALCLQDKKRNKHDIGGSAQKILNRIIFVFFCKDRSLLPEGLIDAIVQKKTNNSYQHWDNLSKLFNMIDVGLASKGINKFNGGLFSYDPSIESYQLDNCLVKRMLELSSYDYASDLDVNILGHIFEKSISELNQENTKKKKSKSSKVSKRKEDGIFYTASYVTTYIVEKAIDIWLDQQREIHKYCDLPKLTKKDLESIKILKSGNPGGTRAVKKHIAFWQKMQVSLENIRILDPACGSGAFLIAAFKKLFREGQRVNEELANFYSGQKGIFDLNKKILKNNLFGVDVHKEAIELTKLSLWILTADKDQQLTSLDKNILCGDAIVESSEYVGDNAFNWKDSFPIPLSEGGFDIVIGNPPYVRQEYIKEIKPYLRKTYKTFDKFADIYIYFYEKSLSLLKTSGILSCISSNKFIKAKYGTKLRQIISEKSEVVELIDFGELPVFSEAATFPLIFTSKNTAPRTKNFTYCQIKDLDFTSLRARVEETKYILPKSSISSSTWYLNNPKCTSLIKRITDEYGTLEEALANKIKYGIKTGLNRVFVVDTQKRDNLVQEDPKSREIIKKWASGDQVRKYFIHDSGDHLVFTRKGTNLNLYPAIKRYLNSHKAALTPGAKGGRRVAYYDINWFEIQDIVAHHKEFDSPKIVYPIIAKEPRFTIDQNSIYTNDKTYIIPTSNRKLLAILNSPVAWFYLMHTCSCLGDPFNGGRLELRKIHVKSLPVPDFQDDREYAEKIHTIEKRVKLYFAKANTFFSYLRTVHGIEKIPTTIKRLENSSLKAFGGFLKKQGGLSEQIKIELFKRFKELIEELQPNKHDIRNIEQNINNMVFSEYKLSDDEIETICEITGDTLFDGKLN